MKKVLITLVALSSLFLLSTAAFADEARSEHYSMPIAQTGNLPVEAPMKKSLSLEDITSYAKEAEKANAGKEELVIMFRDEEPMTGCEGKGCTTTYVVLQIHKHK